MWNMLKSTVLKRAKPVCAHHGVQYKGEARARLSSSNLLPAPLTFGTQYLFESISDSYNLKMPVENNPDTPQRILALWDNLPSKCRICTCEWSDHVIEQCDVPTHFSQQHWARCVRCEKQCLWKGANDSQCPGLPELKRVVSNLFKLDPACAE